MKELTAPTLSTIEEKIIMMLVGGARADNISKEIGIPITAIVELRRKKGIKAWIAELKEARHDLLLSRAIDVVSATLEDKLDMIEEDEDKRLGSSTRKDPIEIAKTLSDMLKTRSAAEEQASDPMQKVYAQIAVIQNGNKEGYEYVNS